MSAPWPTIFIFLTQIVDIFMQKFPKHTHYYLRGFPLFLGAASPPPRSRDTHQTHKCPVTLPQKPVVQVQRDCDLVQVALTLFTGARLLFAQGRTFKS
jgi:hypothetical protein